MYLRHWNLIFWHLTQRHLVRNGGQSIQPKKCHFLKSFIKSAIININYEADFLLVSRSCTIVWRNAKSFLSNFCNVKIFQFLFSKTLKIKILSFPKLSQEIQVDMKFSILGASHPRWIASIFIHLHQKFEK